MFAEIWTAQRLWRSKAALLEMDAAVKSGLDSPEGDEVAAAERALAGLLPMVTSGKFDNRNLALVSKGVMTYVAKEAGGDYGDLASLATEAAVSSMGDILGTVADVNGVAQNANKSVANVGAGFKAAKSIGEKLTHSFGSFAQKKLTSAHVPSSVATPLVAQGEAVVKEIFNKL